MPSETITCRHCLERSCFQRGLCYRCFRTLSIRVKYPPLKSGTAGREVVDRSNETMEDLDALEAAQRPTMPQDSRETDGEFSGSRESSVSMRSVVTFSKRHNRERIL